MDGDPMRPAPPEVSDSPGVGHRHPDGMRTTMRHPFRRLHDRLHENPVTGLITKIVLTVVGGVVLVAGVIMIFTPGQGILAVLLGLAILSLEYQWAARLLHRVKQKAQEARERARAVDPRVRRRRLVIGSALILLAAAGLVGYLLVYDWPRYAVAGWDWVQGLSGVVPELPGM